ncbi:hypothetical protein BJ508DRAFT_412540 [Ascobolus immersus RN42]|uniref:Mid2 domain-containing protein n=1 Tax=Ascobolus immersus RN42 TaxID=1160509 RepID=A0A3N4IHA3_ASCIM|nr:hypothetical protein BJ508DRAFT_412540 [Ascobolus immersus RN42]
MLYPNVKDMSTGIKNVWCDDSDPVMFVTPPSMFAIETPTTTTKGTDSLSAHSTSVASSSQETASDSSFLHVHVNEKPEASRTWIAGAVAGPVGGIALLAVIFFILRRRKKRAAANRKNLSRVPTPLESKLVQEYYPPPPKVELAGSRQPRKPKKKAPTTTSDYSELVGSSVVPMIPAVELDSYPTPPVANHSRNPGSS